MKKKFLFLTLVVTIFVCKAQWLTTGNSGTSSANNFIGTIDNQSLVLKINNSEKLRLTNNGRLVFYNNNSQTFSNNLYIGGGNEIPSNNAGGVNWGNVAVGLGSMNANSTGNANTALGFNSLAANTSGYGNTALGINSMRDNLSGNHNIGAGLNSLGGLTSGDGNTAIGASSMSGTIGFSGTNNTSMGMDVMRGIYNGSYNTVLGARSFRSLKTGSYNIVIGYDNLSSYELNNVGNNIFIGNNIIPINSQPNNELNIGNWIYGQNGKISIGGKSTFTCSDCTDYSLFVKNGIKAEKVKVDIASTNGWADFVFREDYHLEPLEMVEKFIAQNGHLPGVPSAEQVVKEGLDLGKMDAKLLQKIEELTLYSIEQNKKNKDQEKQLESQAEKIDKLEKLLLELASKK